MYVYSHLSARYNLISLIVRQIMLDKDPYYRLALLLKVIERFFAFQNNSDFFRNPLF